MIYNLEADSPTTTKKPTFQPTDFGEGKAGPLELTYSKTLFKPLEPSYNTILTILKDDKSTLPQKMNVIKQQTNLLLSQGKGTINQNIINIQNAAVAKANNNLRRLAPKIKPINPPSTHLRLLQQQQTLNLSNIAQNLNDKIVMGLLQNEIENETRDNSFETKTVKAASSDCYTQTKQQHPDWTDAQINDYCNEDYDYLDQAYNQTQNRLMGMAWYGWRQATQIGSVGVYALAIGNGSLALSIGLQTLGVTTLAAGILFLAANLVANWLTCEDDGCGPCSSGGPVCEDCIDMKNGSPYPVLNWPGEVHYGDRCCQGPCYILGI
jgi:hypothetical protein